MVQHLPFQKSDVLVVDGKVVLFKNKTNIKHPSINKLTVLKMQSY